MRKKIYNRLFIIFIFLTFICSLSGCRYKGYGGEHPDLYTVAIHSVLWNNGYSYATERVTDSKIEELEKDKFGRTLFVYFEKYYSGGEIVFSTLLIQQYSTEKYVYYYEDKNYIVKEQIIYSVLTPFSDEEINQLKELNDWNKELDLNICIEKEITHQKPSLSADEYQTIEDKAIKHLNIKEEQHFSDIDMLTSNENLDFIVYGYVRSYMEKNQYFVAYCHTENNSIIDVEFLILKDLYNYQTELKEFKAKNDWYRKE